MTLQDTIKGRPRRVSAARDDTEPSVERDIAEREGGRGGAERDRLHLALTPRQRERMEYLKSETEAAAYTDVVRAALRLYDALVQEVKLGKEVLVRDADGKETTYRILF